MTKAKAHEKGGKIQYLGGDMNEQEEPEPGPGPSVLGNDTPLDDPERKGPD